MAEPTSNCKAQTAVEQAIRKWEEAGDTTATLYIRSLVREGPIIIPYIPSTVQALRLRCYITRIPLLPESLKVLDVKLENALDELPALPEGLIELEWYGNSQQYHLIDFPQSLKKLTVTLMDDPPNYEWIPDGLLELNMFFYLSSLPIKFPASLNKLHLCIFNDACDSNNCLIFPALPHDLRELFYESRINCFPVLPVSLEKLHLRVWYDASESYGLFVFPTLPCSICEFVYEAPFNRIPTLPDSLKALEISITSRTPQTLPEFPDGLEILNINFMVINELPCALPSCLKIFKCQETYVRRLPALPRGLRELQCDSTCLTYLPVLPSTLEHLSCSDCRLECLPRLPASLKVLTCHCNNIKKFPVYPSYLDVYDDNIRKTRLDIV